MIKDKLICKGKMKIPIGGVFTSLEENGSVSHVPELDEKYQGMEINRVWGDEVAKFTVDDWESFGERLKRLKEPVENE